MQQEGGRRGDSHRSLRPSAARSPLPASVWSTHLHPPSSSILSRSPPSCKPPLRPPIACRRNVCQPCRLSSYFLEPQFPQEQEGDQTSYITGFRSSEVLHP